MYTGFMVQYLSHPFPHIHSISAKVIRVVKVYDYTAKPQTIMMMSPQSTITVESQ